MIWRRRGRTRNKDDELPTTVVLTGTLTDSTTPADDDRGRSTRARARGDGAVAAGGNVSGTAIGDGSFAAHIQHMDVHVNQPDAEGVRRRLNPPPLGHLADREGIRLELEIALSASLANNRPPIIFLEGRGGSGKSTMASILADQESTMARYPGGVIWTTIGQSRRYADLADHINDLCDHLGGPRPSTTDPVMGGAALGEILDSGEPTLLVVDDVWSRDQVAPFLLGGTGSARLFTTRNRGIAPKVASVVEVGAMTEDEARETALSGLPPVGTEVEARLLGFAKGWPVLLGLINASLRTHVAAGGPPDEVATWLADILGTHGPAALDGANSGDLQATIAATVSASLSLLTEDQQQRYLDLAAFRDDSEIPEHVVAQLWAVTGGLSAYGSRQLMILLSSLRLVKNMWVDGEPAIALHDELRSYLIHRLSADELRMSHQSVINALSALLPRGTAPDHWWELQKRQHFAIQQLPYHLFDAGWTDELANLSCDLRWIETQIQHLGSVVPAISGLAMVDDPRAGALLAVLEQNVGVCIPEDVPNAVAATLLSRASQHRELADIAKTRLKSLSGPRLLAVWPLPDELFHPIGHTGPIGDCAISPDGALLATVSDDQLVIVWDRATLGVNHTLHGHRQRARACEFSPSGELLLSAGMDGTLRIWDPRIGQLTSTFSGMSARVLSCAWSPDGRYVAGTTGDGRVHVFDAGSGESVFTFLSLSGCEWDCAFSPTAAELASVGEDGHVRVWSLESGKLLRDFAIHSNRIRTCNYDRTGTRLVTGSSDKSACIVDPATGRIAHRLRGHTDRLRSCVFSDDGELVASAAEDRILRVWRTSSGELLHAFEGHTDWVGGCVFDPTSAELVSCGGDASVRIWRVDGGQQARVVAGAGHAAESIDFDDTASEVVIGGYDGSFSIVDLPSGNRRSRIAGHSGRVLDVALAEVGIFSAGADGRVHLTHRDGRRIRDFDVHAGRVWGCAIAPDGLTFASAGEDGLIVVHDIETGEVRRSLLSHGGHVADCTYDPSGEFLASAGDDGAIHLWHVDSGRLHLTLTTGRDSALWSCRFSPAGDLVAAAGEPSGQVVIWDVGTAKAHTIIHVGADRITNCSFSPDGALIATCDDDAFLGIWDVSTGSSVTGIRTAFPLSQCEWKQTPEGRSLLGVAGKGGAYLFEYLPE